MRILHYCEQFSALTETFLYDYVTELERQGVDNHVVTTRRVNEAQRPYAKVSVVPAAGRWNPSRLGYRTMAGIGIGSADESAWPATRQRIARAARRLGPHAIHAHFGHVGVLIAPVAARLGIPLVVTFYGYDISALARDPEWQRRYRRMWPTVTAATVLSEKMRQRVIEMGCPPAKTHLVRLARHQEGLEFRLPSRRVRHFVTVGRLVEKKGHFDAVRAIRRAMAAGPTDLRLDIVGDGSLREELQRFIDDEGLADIVHLRGALPNNETMQLLRDADAMLLCSRTAASGDEEGTPTSLVEAQLLGLPCVTTDHSGIPEVIPESSYRFVAPEGDPEAIARCIVDLAGCAIDELHGIARRGRARMESEFDPSTECGKFIAIYRRATAGAATEQMEGHLL